jgi:streptomycin 6-kinase
MSVGSKVVLKMLYERQELQQEVDALRFYDGNSCVRLIDYDLTANAILLEQLSPATSLKSLATNNEQIAAQVIAGLHAIKLPRDNHFPRIEQWLKELDDNSSIPQNYLIKAKNLAATLLVSQGELKLLHGDLHHDNILLNDKSWIAIDPKGVVGEAEYEVGAFIRNPMPELLNDRDLAGRLTYRIDLFASLLNLNKQRIKEWSYVQAVLSGCWGGSYKDKWLQIANIIETIN